MSKSSDQLVLERRLKPIYDAIDAGNNKKAIQEADKVLKKHPATHTAKVLKALALIRSDKQTEAWPLIDEVESMKEESIDENTLQAMCHCFKEAYTPERISALYERICCKFPKNEQYRTHLFMSYVRTRNYKLQQKTALALFKEFQRNPYYFWNVMSIVMQAICGDEKLAKTMLYPLAEKMVVKMMQSNSIQAEAECNLYVLILEREGKYEEAARFLESDPLVRRFVQQPDHFLFYRILSLHQKAENHLLVVEKCISELKNEPDDWNLWKYLFESAFAHMSQELCTDEEKNKLIDRIVERILSLIEKSVRLDDKKTPKRGIYLARLTLINRLLETQLTLRTQLGTIKLGEPLEHLVEYITMFYSKPCCFTDIRSFMPLLGEHQIEPFVQRISDLVETVRNSIETGDNHNVKAENVRWAEIILNRVKRALGLHSTMSNREKRQLCAELIKVVEECCAHSDLTAAAYAQIGAHLLWDIFVEEDDMSAMYELILLMEWMHSRHKSDPLCRLVLCKAYALIGATAQIQIIMQSLDVKNVQRDTLGYLLFGLLEQYGRFNAGIIYYTELSVFFDQTEREISECLTTAYKNGNFVQVPRLVELLSRMTKSIIAVGADIESRALSGCFVVEKLDHLVETLRGDQQPIDFTMIEDNRDLNVIPSLDSGNPTELIEKVKQRSYFEQVDSMKLRDLLLKCVAGIASDNSADSSNNTNNNNSDKAYSTSNLTSLLTQLKKHSEHCQQTYSNEALDEIQLLQSPPSQCLNIIVNGSHIPLILKLLSSAVDVMKCCDEGNHQTSKNAQSSATDEKFKEALPSVESVQELVMLIAEGELPLQGGPLRLHTQLRHCSFALQTFALCLIAMKLIERRIENYYHCCIAGASSGQGAASKGKKGSTKGARKHSSAALVQIAEIRSVINKGIRFVDDLLVKYQNELNADELIPELSEDFCSEDFTKILLSQKANVDSAIVASYALSLSDMRETIERLLNPKWT